MGFKARVSDAEELMALRAFFEEISGSMFSNPGDLESGVLARESYDKAKHGEVSGDPEPGDLIYVKRVWA